MSSTNNRRERRKYANELKLKKKTIKLNELFDRFKRTNEMGSLIHQKNIQDSYDALKEFDVEKELAILNGLVEKGFSEEEAWKFINDNKKNKNL